MKCMQEIAIVELEETCAHDALMAALEKDSHVF